MNWKKLNTLSHQIKEGEPVSKPFLWFKDEMGNIHIKSNKTKKTFSPSDYSAMLGHIENHKNGVPLGSRMDGTVPRNSLGALMEKRFKSASIRRWCSHLASIAVHEDGAIYEDKGRGPGKGIWIFPKN